MAILFRSRDSHREYERALEAYRDPARIDFVKLVDGGVSDNLGLTGFTIARAQAGTAYGPLTPAQAVRLDRVIVVVVDSGREADPAWARTVRGPKLPALVDALGNAATGSSMRAAYDAFSLTMQAWRRDVVRYR